MLKKLRIDRDDYKHRIRVAFDAMTSGSITPDDYNENKGRYDQEIARIDGQLARLEDADQNFYATASYLLQLFKHGDKIFEVANDEEKRQIISIVLSNLSLKGKTVRFTPNEPFATVLKLSESSIWQEWAEGFQTLDDLQSVDLSPEDEQRIERLLNGDTADDEEVTC